MPRKISEVVEEARQMPHGDRAELIEPLSADTAKNIDPKIEKAWAMKRCDGSPKWKAARCKEFRDDQVAAEIRIFVGLP